ncbi:MAG TPA: hypothetical protein VGM14_00495 [Streptosporangiaceae bacterium]|jgi:hypothetical protein
MTPRRPITALAGAVAIGSAVLLAGAATAGATPIATAATKGPWTTAIEVPGLATLNAGGRAEVQSVSCAAPGSCAAVGSYLDGSGNLQGFVVSQQDGVWGNATEVPGLAALNVAGFAEALTVSCGSAGNCAAGGYFYDHHNHQQAFVVNEQNGAWGNAAAVPRLAALSLGFAEVVTISCEPTGSCSAGGYYYDRHGQQAFVASEQNGTWGGAIEVPGLAALNAGFKGLDAIAGVSSVSCNSPGDCAAAGGYQDRHGNGQGFLVSERNGTWAKAIKPPGLVPLNAGGEAGVNMVSCTSAGNCAAGGSYKVKAGHAEGFVISERNGTWGKASKVPGLASLTPPSEPTRVNAVDCTSAGNCVAAGGYQDRHAHSQGFVVSKRNGTWAKAVTVPGLPALNTGGSARVLVLSCSSTGNCSAGGTYLNRQKDQEAFVVSEQNGTWGKAIEIPGLGSLNTGVAQISEVSCAPAGGCSAAGFYQDQQQAVQGFVVSHP